MPEKEGDKPTRSRTVRLRALLQALVAIAAWAGFLFLWYLTLADRVTGRRPLYELIAIVIVAVVIVSITYLWIRHNLNIYKRKGPRRRVPPGEHDFSHD